MDQAHLEQWVVQLKFWPKSIEFVRDGIEQQQESLPEDNYSLDTSLYLKNDMDWVLFIFSSGD